jgi:ABC-2 type transport system ATP-binding protein
MSQAVIVDDVCKKFGKPEAPLWQRLWKKPESKNGNGNGNGNGHNGNGHNGHSSQTVETTSNTLENGGSNGNGHKKDEKSRFIMAVDHVSFEIGTGEIFGVLGPNGGGKSTLIRLISTLLIPDSGTIQVFGYDVVKNSFKVQELINRVSVEASFFKKLSPMENLLYGARLYGLEGGQTQKRVVEILTRLGLEKRSIYNPMEDMSRGMQQKVAIARALLSHPKLLLLDEPTTGLDPRSKRDVQAIVKELCHDFGTTILLTTHDMYEADTLCNRIAIMNSGKIVALDTPTALKSLLPPLNGKDTTLEDVFLKLTGKELKNKEEEEEPVP